MQPTAHVAMSGARYSAKLARLSSRAVASKGRPDVVSRRLGEELRAEYLDIMKEQAERHPSEPDWFRRQLGGRDATTALDEALAGLPPDASAEAATAAAESRLKDTRLTFTMQGRSFSYPASSDTAIFIGRETHCDAVTTPTTDRSVSRVSAILYQQPSRGLLLVCDPGNLSGIRVRSREHKQLGLPRSVPFSRLVLPLVWGECVDVDVCGVRVRLFPRDASESPSLANEEARPAAAGDLSGPGIARREDAAAAPAAASIAARSTPAAAPTRSQPVAVTPPDAADTMDARDVDTSGSPQSDARVTCRICLDQPRSCCFIPCRHQICCVACAQELLRSPRPLCPICRSVIATVVPIDMRQAGRSYAMPLALGKRKRSQDSPDRANLCW